MMELLLVEQNCTILNICSCLMGQVFQIMDHKMHVGRLIQSLEISEQLLRHTKQASIEASLVHSKKLYQQMTDTATKERCCNRGRPKLMNQLRELTYHNFQSLG